MTRILEVQSSARKTGSVSRTLAKRLATGLVEKTGADLMLRDVAEGLPFVTDAWVKANFTPHEDRTDDQRSILATSDALIAELEAADTIVIGLPIYNFGVPATLKAWIDQIARARKTFQYTENGPKGLLEGKKAYIVVASGGTEVGSDIDFASRYLVHALGFIGIEDVTLIRADQAMVKGDTARQGAEAQVDAILDGLKQAA